MFDRIDAGLAQLEAGLPLPGRGPSITSAE
jgi:hypothetical protein